MAESYPLSLALLDFIPNLAFLIGAYFLVRISLLVSSRSCSRIAMLGSLLVFLGGLLKAIWKLLYTTGAANITLFSEIQFVLLGPGFLILLIATIIMFRKKPIKIDGRALPAMVAWKIPFVIVMTLCSLGAQGILTYIAFRRGVRLAAAGFIIAALGLLAMGGMSSGEQTISRQWIEEGINTLGQLGFMAGSLILYQDFKAKGC